MDRRALKQLGLRTASTAVFRATTVNANGKTRIVLRPSAAARRKLKKMRSLKLKVSLQATAPDGRVKSITRRVTIKR